MGGAVAYWLEHLSLIQAIREQALARDLVFLGKTHYCDSNSLQPGV